jgi:uncharacterized protein YdcH (DUF465 family)
MSHTPHELADEFPEHLNRLHELRETNAHFRKLADEYHELNRAVHRAETNVEPTDDLHASEMRKQRLYLKDQIADLLRTN